MIVGLTSAARINPYAALLIDELRQSVGVDFVLTSEQGRIGDLRERLQRRGLRAALGAVGRRARRSGGVSPLAAEARRRGLDLQRPLTDLCRDGGIEVIRVDQLSSADAAAAVRAQQTDILINSGGGLFRGALLRAPRIGLLNAHMARLPDLRGVDVLEWSLLLGVQPGITVHWIDAGVDTGGIVNFTPLEPQPGDSLDSLRDRALLLSVQAIAGCLPTLTSRANEAPTGARGPQYFSLHPRLRFRAMARLDSIQ